MKIVINLPDTDITENLIRAAKWEDGSLFDIVLRRAMKDAIILPKGHGELKDFEKIYADMTEKEELARQRVIDTPRNNLCYVRYIAQLNERTAFKEMLYDAPTIIEADKEDKK